MNKKVFFGILVIFLLFISSISVYSATCVPDETDSSSPSSDFFECQDVENTDLCEYYDTDDYSFTDDSRNISDLNEEGGDCELVICKNEVYDVEFCGLTSRSACNAIDSAEIFEDGADEDFLRNTYPEREWFNCDEESLNLSIELDGDFVDDVLVEFSIENSNYQGFTDDDGLLSFNFFLTTDSVDTTISFERDGYTQEHRLILNKTHWQIYEYDDDSNLESEGVFDSTLNIDFYYEEGKGTLEGSLVPPTGVDYDEVFIGYGEEQIRGEDDSYSMDVPIGSVSVYSYILGYPPLMEHFYFEAGEIQNWDIDYEVEHDFFEEPKTIYGSVDRINSTGDYEPVDSGFIFLVTEGRDGRNYNDFVLIEDGEYEIETNYNSTFVLTAITSGFNEEVKQFHYSQIDDPHEVNFTFDIYGRECESGKYFEGVVVEGGPCSDPDEASCYQNFECYDGECIYENEITFQQHPNFCDNSFFCDSNAECVLQPDTDCNHVPYDDDEGKREDGFYSFDDTIHSQRSNCILSENAYCNGSDEVIFYDLDDSNQRDEYCSLCGHDSVCTDTSCDFEHDLLTTYRWDDGEWNDFNLDGDVHNDIFCSECPRSSLCQQADHCHEVGSCCDPDYGVGPELDYDGCDSGQSCYSRCEIDGTCGDEKRIRDADYSELDKQVCRGLQGIISNDDRCCSVNIDPRPEDISCPEVLYIDNENIENHPLEIFSNTFPNYDEIDFCYCGDDLIENLPKGDETYCCAGSIQDEPCDFRHDVSGDVYYNLTFDDSDDGFGRWDFHEINLIDDFDSSVSSDGGHSEFNFEEVPTGEFTIRLFAELGGMTHTYEKEIYVDNDKENIEVIFDVNEVNLNVSGSVYGDFNGEIYDGDDMKGTNVIHDNIRGLSDSNGNYNLPEEILYDGSATLRALDPYDGLYFESKNIGITNDDLEGQITPSTINIEKDNIELTNKYFLDLSFSVFYINDEPIEDVEILVTSHEEEEFESNYITLDHSQDTDNEGNADFELMCDNTYEFIFLKEGLERKTFQRTFNCDDDDKEALEEITLGDISCTFDKPGVELEISEMSYDDLSVTFDIIDSCDPDYYELYANVSSVTYDNDINSLINFERNDEVILLDTIEDPEDSFTVGNLPVDLGYEFFVKSVYEEPFFDKVKSNPTPHDNPFVFSSFCKISYDLYDGQEKFCGHIVDQLFRYDEDFTDLKNNVFTCNYSYIHHTGDETRTREVASFDRESDHMCQQTEESAFLLEDGIIDCSNCGSLLGLFSHSSFNYLDYEFDVPTDAVSNQDATCDLGCYLRDDTHSKIVSETCKEISSCYDYSYLSVDESHEESPCLNYDCDFERVKISETSTYDVVRPKYDSFSNCDLFNQRGYISDSSVRFFDNFSKFESICEAYGDCSLHMIGGDHVCIDDHLQPTDIKRDGSKFDSINERQDCNRLVSPDFDYKIDLVNMSNVNKYYDFLVQDNEDIEKYNQYVCYNREMTPFIEKSSPVISVESGFLFTLYDELFADYKNHHVDYLNLSFEIDGGQDILSHSYKFSYEDLFPLYQRNNFALDSFFDRENYAISVLNKELDLCSDFEDLSDKTLFNTNINISIENHPISTIEDIYVDCVEPEVNFSYTYDPSLSFLGETGIARWRTNVTIKPSLKTDEKIVFYEFEVYDEDNELVERLSDFNSGNLTPNSEINYTLNELSDGQYVLNYTLIDKAGNINEDQEYFFVQGDQNLILDRMSTKSRYDDLNLTFETTASSCRWSLNEVNDNFNYNSNLRLDEPLETKSFSEDLSFVQNYPENYFTCQNCTLNTSYTVRGSLRVRNYSKINLSINNLDGSDNLEKTFNPSKGMIESVGYDDILFSVDLDEDEFNPGEYRFTLSSDNSSNVDLSYFYLTQDLPKTYHNFSSDNEVDDCDDDGNCEINLYDELFSFPRHSFSSNHRVYLSCEIEIAEGEEFIIGEKVHSTEFTVDRQPPFALLRYGYDEIWLNEDSLYEVGTRRDTSGDLTIQAQESRILNRITGEDQLDQPGSFGLSNPEVYFNYGDDSIESQFEFGEGSEIGEIVIDDIDGPTEFCMNITDLSGINTLNDICIRYIDDTLDPVYQINLSGYDFIEDHEVNLVKDNLVELNYFSINPDESYDDRIDNKNYHFGNDEGDNYLREDIEDEIIFIFFKPDDFSGDHIEVKYGNNYRESYSVDYDPDNDWYWITLSNDPDNRYNSFGKNMPSSDTNSFDFEVLTDGIERFYITSFDANEDFEISDDLSYDSISGYDIVERKGYKISGDLLYSSYINSEIILDARNNDQFRRNYNDEFIIVEKEVINVSNIDDSEILTLDVGVESLGYIGSDNQEAHFDIFPPEVDYNNFYEFDYGEEINLSIELSDEEYGNYLDEPFSNISYQYEIIYDSEFYPNPSFNDDCENWDKSGEGEIECNEQPFNYIEFDAEFGDSSRVERYLELDKGTYYINLNYDLSEGSFDFIYGSDNRVELSQTDEFFSDIIEVKNDNEPFYLIFISDDNNEASLRVNDISVSKSAFDSYHHSDSDSINCTTGCDFNISLSPEETDYNGMEADGFYDIGVGEYDFYIEATDYFGNTKFSQNTFEVEPPEVPSVTGNSFLNHEETILYDESEMLVVVNSSSPILNKNLSITYSDNSEYFEMHSMDGRCSILNDFHGVSSNFESTCENNFGNFYYTTIDYSEIENIIGSQNKREFSVELKYSDLSRTYNKKVDLFNQKFDTLGLRGDDFRWWYYDTDEIFTNREEDFPLMINIDDGEPTYSDLNYDVTVCFNKDEMDTTEIPFDENDCDIFEEYNNEILNLSYDEIKCEIQEVITENTYNVECGENELIPDSPIIDRDRDFVGKVISPGQIYLHPLRKSYSEGDKIDVEVVHEGGENIRENFILDDFDFDCNGNDYCNYTGYVYGKDEFGNFEYSYDSINVHIKTSKPEINLIQPSNFNSSYSTFGNNRIEFDIQDDFLDDVNVVGEHFDFSGDLENQDSHTRGDSVTLFNRNIDEGEFNISVYARDKAYNELNKDFWFIFTESTRMPRIDSLNENHVVKDDDRIIFTQEKYLDLNLTYNRSNDDQSDIHITKSKLLDEDGEIINEFDVSNINRINNYSFTKNFDFTNNDISSGDRLTLRLRSYKIVEEEDATKDVNHDIQIVYIDSENTYSPSADVFYTNERNFDVLFNIYEQTCEKSIYDHNFCTYIDDLEIKTDEFLDSTSNQYYKFLNEGNIDYEKESSDNNKINIEYDLDIHRRFNPGSHELELELVDIFNNKHDLSYEIFFDNEKPSLLDSFDDFYIGGDDGNYVNITEIERQNTNMVDFDCSFNYNEGSGDDPEIASDFDPTSFELKLYIGLIDNGNMTAECFVEDKASNKKEFSFDLLIDRTEPQIDFNYDEFSGNDLNHNLFLTWTNEDGALTIKEKTSDEFSSGIKEFRYNIVNEDCNDYHVTRSNAETFIYDNPLDFEELTIDFSDVNFDSDYDDYNLCYYVEDFAGNEIELDYFEFTYKDNKPELNELYDYGCNQEGLGIISESDYEFMSSCKEPYLIYNISDLDRNSLYSRSLSQENIDNENLVSSSSHIDSGLLNISFEFEDNDENELDEEIISFDLTDGANNRKREEIKINFDTTTPEITIDNVKEGGFLSEDIYDVDPNKFFVTSNNFDVNFSTSHETSCRLCNQETSCGVYFNQDYQESYYDQRFSDGSYDNLECTDPILNEERLWFDIIIDNEKPIIHNTEIDAVKDPNFHNYIISSSSSQSLGEIKFDTYNDEDEEDSVFTKCFYFAEENEITSNTKNDFLSNLDDWEFKSQIFSENHSYDFTDLLVDISSEDQFDPDALNGFYELGVLCKDVAGNIMSDPKIKNITVDLDEFAIIDINPPNENVFYELGDEEISVMFNEENDNEQISCEFIYEDGRRGSFERKDNYNSHYEITLNEEGKKDFDINCTYQNGGETISSAVDMIYYVDKSGPNISSDFNYDLFAFNPRNPKIYSYYLQESDLKKFINLDSDGLSANILVEEEFSYIEDVSYNLRTMSDNTYDDSTSYSENIDGDEKEFSFDFEKKDTFNNYPNRLFELKVDAKNVGGNTNSKKYYILNHTSGSPEIRLGGDFVNVTNSEEYDFDVNIADNHLYRVWVELNDEENYSFSSHDSQNNHHKFSFNVELNESIDTNEMTIFAENYAGDVSTRTEEIVIDKELNYPNFTFYLEDNNYNLIKTQTDDKLIYETNTDFLTAEFEVDDDVTELRYENHEKGYSRNINVQKQVFDFNFDLDSSGKQNITFEIEDKAGNIRKNTTKFYFNDSSPELNLDVIPKVTTSGEIFLRGTTSESSEGINISIIDENNNEIDFSEYESSDFKGYNENIESLILSENVYFGNNSLIIDDDIEGVYDNHYIWFNQDDLFRREIIDSNYIGNDQTKLILDERANNVIDSGEEVYVLEEEYPSFYFDETFDIENDGDYILEVKSYDRIGNVKTKEIDVRKDSELSFDVTLEPPYYYDSVSALGDDFEGYVSDTYYFENNNNIIFELNITPDIASSPYCKLVNDEYSDFALPFEQEFKRVSENKFELKLTEDDCVDLDNLNYYLDDEGDYDEENDFLCSLGGGKVVSNLKIICEDDYDSDLVFEKEFLYGHDFSDWNNNPLENLCDFGGYCTGSVIELNVEDTSGEPVGNLDVGLKVDGQSSLIEETDELSGEVQILTRSGKNKVFVDSDDLFVSYQDNVLDDIESNEIYEDVSVIVSEYSKINLTTDVDSPKVLIESEDEVIFEDNIEGYSKQFDYMKPGNYDVYIMKKGYEIKEFPLDLGEGETENIDANLSELEKVSLSGFVNLTDNESNEDVFVSYQNNDFNSDVDDFTTSDDGEFEFEVFENYSYSLNFEKLGYYDVSLKLDSPDDDLYIEMNPLPTTDFGGYIKNYDGDYLENIEISYHENSFNTNSNEDGYYELSDVFYKGDIFIIEEDSISLTPVWDYLDEELEENTFNEVNFTMYPLYNLEVTFLDPRNEPVEGLDVEIYHSKQSHSDETDSRGKFTESDLYSSEGTNENHIIKWEHEYFESGSKEIEFKGPDEFIDIEIDLSYKDDELIEGVEVR